MIKIFIATILISGPCFAIPNANKAREITKQNIVIAEQFRRQAFLEKVYVAIESSTEFQTTVEIINEHGEMIKFVIKKLENKGYKVKIILGLDNKSHLHIDWGRGK